MAELKPCGTPAAYRRHKRNQEPVDDACRMAHNASCSPGNRARSLAKEQLAREYPARFLELLRKYQQEVTAGG
jgi:hypothetical protein